MPAPLPASFLRRREMKASSALSPSAPSVSDSFSDSTRLRKRLAGSGAGIRTLRGLGYVLEENADGVGKA